MLQHLSQAGVLGSIAELLDRNALQTVICHIDEFCRSIPMSVVKQTLTELFGRRWQLYYESYVAYVHELGPSLEQDFRGKMTLDGERAALDSHPWGLGYDLECLSDASMINGYVVVVAIRTLNSIAKNCENYDYSFIPGEPSECGINRISFVENERLVWIQYHPKSYDYFSARDIDTVNMEYFLSTNPNSFVYGRQDGQILLPDNEPALSMVSVPRFQETCPKEVSGFESELWDIAARPHPQCVWSSLWEASIPMSRIDVRDRVLPLTTFEPGYFHGVLIPSTKGIVINFDQDFTMTKPAAPSYFQYRPSRDPLRFIRCPSTFAVIDLMHLESMQFRGTKRLRKPRLSRDSKYLGAIADIKSGGENQASHLGIWRVALPRPVLVWKNGVRLQCQYCEWFAEHDWLLVVCRVHGFKAFCLMSASPVAIDLNELVPPLLGAKKRILLRVCGIDSNILALDSPETKSYWFVKLSEYKAGKWKAERLNVPLQSTAVTDGQTVSLGSEATSYIHKIGKRYCLGTLGDLFDLAITDAPHGTADSTGKKVQRVNPRCIKVLAMWESPEGNKTITVNYDDRKAQPDLVFWQLSALGGRRQLTSSGDTIRYSDAELVVFSPDGTKIWVSPKNDDIGGWLVLIHYSSGSSQPDICVKSVPQLDFSVAHDTTPANWRTLSYPLFLTKDTIAIVCNYCTDTGTVQIGTESYLTFQRTDKLIYLLFIDETSEITCSTIGRPPLEGDDATRYLTPRWIDVLRAKIRDLEYCQSINFVGRRGALSPGHRFLLYPGRRNCMFPVVPQVELHDLCCPIQARPRDIRRSWRSVLYAMGSRRDYRRMPKYSSIEPVNSVAFAHPLFPGGSIPRAA